MILCVGDDYYWNDPEGEASCYVTIHKINTDGTCKVSASGEFFTVGNGDLSHYEDDEYYV